MITAILTIWADCAGQESHGRCHATIDAELNLHEHEVSQDAHEIWLCENGWLAVGELGHHAFQFRLVFKGVLPVDIGQG